MPVVTSEADAKVILERSFGNSREGERFDTRGRGFLGRLPPNLWECFTSSMPKSRSDRFSLDEIVVAINSAHATNTWAFRWREVVSVLQHSLDFDPSIYELDALQLIETTVLPEQMNLPVTRKALLAQLNRAEAELLRTPLQSFTVHCRLSVRWNEALRAERIAGSSVRFPRTAARFDQLQVAQAHDALERQPPDYLSALIQVRSRSRFSALDLGVRAIDEVRALWNYSMNRRVWDRVGPSDRTPVNVVRLGAVQTLHDRSGTPALETFMHDPNATLSPPVSLASKWSRVLHETKVLKRHLRQHPYGSQLREALVRYSRALDSNDYDVSFVQLWGLLEYLTDFGGKHETAVKRIVALHHPEQHPFERIVLHHLRAYRNRIAHDGESSFLGRARVFQVKRYVERAMAFHLGMGSRLRTLQDAAAFLDLPADSRTLRRQLRAMQFALQFRR